MHREHCTTRNHIDLWNNSVLPARPVRISLWTVLRGSLLPLVVWLGAAGAGYAFIGPAVPTVLGGLFALFLLAGFALRLGKRHSIRCSLYGTLGGVLDKSLDGF
ncbi:hypothetical protein GCM10010329_45930 [Streptomyces spiroverticillatus]|uniref:Uncharacterized protein n=1 Tax=Streptomyces finlayi TaxID=67296 RepID=A0A919CBL9_9ACTN|nr:hypothetical protein [Streptomyces finlayi]GHA17669.1 hypothetical protein GCM10010329_45930 [Streptomyces spiroverticillatus]GHC99491.1 hypothetical protein GCM10010334_43100 [Streptomyces finlayi]